MPCWEPYLRQLWQSSHCWCKCACVCENAQEHAENSQGIKLLSWCIIYTSVCLPACLSAWLSVYLFVCLSIPVYLFVFLALFSWDFFQKRPAILVLLLRATTRAATHIIKHTATHFHTLPSKSHRPDRTPLPWGLDVCVCLCVCVFVCMCVRLCIYLWPHF